MKLLFDFRFLGLYCIKKSNLSKYYKQTINYLKLYCKNPLLLSNLLEL